MPETKLNRVVYVRLYRFTFYTAQAHNTFVLIAGLALADLTSDDGGDWSETVGQDSFIYIKLQTNSSIVSMFKTTKTDCCSIHPRDVT